MKILIVLILATTFKPFEFNYHVADAKILPNVGDSKPVNNLVQLSMSQGERSVT